MATQGIDSDPDVMMGKPVVEGMRITVEPILDELGAEVLRADVAYPVSKSVA